MDLKRRAFNRVMRKLARPFPASTFDDRMRVLRSEIDDYLGDAEPVAGTTRRAKAQPNRIETGGVDRSAGG